MDFIILNSYINQAASAIVVITEVTSYNMCATAWLAIVIIGCINRWGGGGKNLDSPALSTIVTRPSLSLFPLDALSLKTLPFIATLLSITIAR